MKSILVLLVFLTLGVFCHASTDTSELLEKTEGSFPEKYRSTAAIAEKRPSTMAEKIESFDLLQRNFKKSWIEDLNSIEKIAPSDNAKAIFFKAAQILPRKDYIDFLGVSCDLAKEGKLSKQQLKWALFPSEKHLREMWGVPEPSRELRVVAERGKIVFSDDPRMLEFFDGVISGKVAASAKKFHERYDGPSPEKRPVRRTSQGHREADDVLPASNNQKRGTPIMWVMVAVVCVIGLISILLRFVKRRE